MGKFLKYFHADQVVDEGDGLASGKQLPEVLENVDRVEIDQGIRDGRNGLQGTCLHTDVIADIEHDSQDKQEHRSFGDTDEGFPKVEGFLLGYYSSQKAEEKIQHEQPGNGGQYTLNGFKVGQDGGDAYYGKTFYFFHFLLILGMNEF